MLYNTFHKRIKVARWLSKALLAFDQESFEIENFIAMENSILTSLARSTQEPLER